MKKNNEKLIKGKALYYNVAIQQWYQDSIIKLVKKMSSEVYKAIKPNYKELKTQITFDESISSQMGIILNKLSIKFTKEFKIKGKSLSKSLLNRLFKYTRFSFNENIKQIFTDNSKDFILKGSFISGPMKEIIKASITENVNLITNIQEDYLRQITGAVMRSITGGQGTVDIEQELIKYKGMTERRARNIARDQTAKVSVSLELRNMQDNNMNYFEWLHSGGGKDPRDYHLKDVKNGGLNHLICDIRSPPIINQSTGERGFPGQLPYCRCVMKPIIKFEEG